MAFKDIREFAAALEKAREAIRVEQEVDWDLEAGAIARRACEIGAPAPFFQSIKHYPEHRLLAAMLASFKRVAIAMGLGANASIREVVDAFYERRQTHIKPVATKDAPCQQNMVTGKDVDLTMLPAPMVHDGDGGRYLGTWHFIVTKDPVTGWVNWGTYRQMVHNERLLGTLVLPYSDIGKMMTKAEAKGEPIPFATVIGADPLCSITGCITAGVQVSEVDVAGGLRGEPVELVKCKTVDLEVPAHAEIVLEGHVLPGMRVDEGPFGEYTGFRSSPRYPRPVFQVDCITWRNDPILTMCSVGVPTDENHIITGPLGLSALVRSTLESYGMPITGVFTPPESCGFMVIIATKKPYNNIAAHIANIVSGQPFVQIAVSQIIVVDDTVDPFNMGEVIHAMATKLHPLKGTFTFPCMGWPLAPYLSLAERTQGKGGKIVYDCTWPLEWDPETEKPAKSSFREVYPEELQKKILDNWRKYGYK